MKQAAKVLNSSVLIGGIFLASGSLAIHYIEREANIGLASGDLRQLWLACKSYADRNEGGSPETVQELVDGGFLFSDSFEYNGIPRNRAIEPPMIVHKGLMNFKEPEKAIVLARQRWSDKVELVLYTSGKVVRRTP